MPAFPTRSEVWLYLLEALGHRRPLRRAASGRRIGPWTSSSQAGTGRSGFRLLRLLAERRPPRRGLIRNPDHAADLTAVGAEAVVCDMEALDDLSECCAGADAVVFAAGAGPGSGPERKRTVDYGARGEADGGRRRIAATSW